MRQIFKIFFTAEGTRPWLVLICLLFGGLAEAFGIGSIVPMLTSVLASETNKPSTFEVLIKRGFEVIGLEPSFANIIMLVLGIMLLRSLLLFAAMSYASITAARVAVGFRRKLIRAVLDARWSYYASQSTGRLANHVGNDATLAGEAYLTCATIAACSFQVLAYVIVSMLINWQVACAGIAGGLIIMLASSRFIKIVKSAGFKIANRVGLLSEELVDVLSNIKALKSMDRGAAVLSHIDHVIGKLKKAMIVFSFSRYGVVYGIDFLVAVLVAVGAYAAVNVGKVAISEVMVLGVLFFQVVSYAAKLQRFRQVAAQFQAGYSRVDEALTQARIEREHQGGQLTPELGAGVVFDDVSFNHGDIEVLRNVSLQIPSRKITVIQGPSGSGKTTLLDLLVGFHRPHSGRIQIGESDLAQLDTKSWRRNIGYVPQELALLHDTVASNITIYDDEISDDDIAHAVSLSGVGEFVERLPNGLQTDVGEFGGKLSGGQRQRISLARALVHKPEVLILDEVTSALDPDTENEIVNKIAALRGKYTIVAITHRPAWTGIADRLYTLKDGKAVLQKTKRKD